MPRYEIDPITGAKTKVSGTEYIPPCLVKTAAKKSVEAPDIQTDAEPYETGNKEAD